MRILPTALLCIALAGHALGQTYSISTFAGGGLPINLPGPSVSLFFSGTVAVDRNGNVFFSDSGDNIVLRLDAKSGIVTLVAGNGTQGFGGDDGLATQAQLNQPLGMAVDSAGNL